MPDIGYWVDSAGARLTWICCSSQNADGSDPVWVDGYYIGQSDFYYEGYFAYLDGRKFTNVLTHIAGNLYSDGNGTPVYYQAGYWIEGYYIDEELLIPAEGYYAYEDGTRVNIKHPVYDDNYNFVYYADQNDIPLMTVSAQYEYPLYYGETDPEWDYYTLQYQEGAFVITAVEPRIFSVQILTIQSLL
jgi:hypothetical protein